MVSLDGGVDKRGVFSSGRESRVAIIKECRCQFLVPSR